ncbi:GNAT family N-acetyltransferase [Rhizobium leguminosarum]|jgi:GNAT superfamily N-acetyltransferase|uniref:GNAT family N-acetyltransferase n=1 Tax=Rhizobium leguminosarum TaxID=384 RepID=A0A4Q8XQT3_RHILE|nr:GNAT family N-acetyltransferase [Rhizobium leguminosarum]TAV41740.1 GNAT family N-acetyltransferase [Rhizobium leguminosarum]TAV42207.1 GNAT family N-acetyltransferase [Rhizobium leguminosarum]TAV61457.1 GNAT family N-acetyltransferase [Rhizobium leguminosarum]TAV81664.1 GNAT family N-acetyltransferase [Rhizobium leguminosarum]TAV82188.1 GNAT family N-acetyltransferase [Rhizobium leguminosarum]
MDIDDTEDDLTTRTGFRFHVRRARPRDEAVIAEFFTHVTPEDLRFRFMSGMKTVSHDRLVEMTRVNDPGVVNFLAFSPSDTLLAVAMLASGEDKKRGEVALSIREDSKHKGISWEILAHICRYAKRHGFDSVESLESRANHATIELERDMAFRVADFTDDPTMVVLRRDLKAPSLPDSAEIARAHN